MPGRPEIQAPADRLRYLQQLQAQYQGIEKKRLEQIDVFAQIGYEPSCKHRFTIRKQVAAMIGAESPFDPAVTAAAEGLLPPPCGECPQEQFHAATEFDVLYGGAAGGGKSVALVAEGLRACARYPGLRTLLVRRTFDELEERSAPAHARRIPLDARR